MTEEGDGGCGACVGGGGGSRQIAVMLEASVAGINDT